MSDDYRLNLLSEELDKYKVAVLKLTEENERLKATHLQLQSSELKQHLEKVNCERENYKLRKENEELKKRQITKNGFICDCEQNEKYRQALEEIREVLKLYADSWVDEKVYPNLHYDNTKAKEGLLKIDEVLK